MPVGVTTNQEVFDEEVNVLQQPVNIKIIEKPKRVNERELSDAKDNEHFESLWKQRQEEYEEAAAVDNFELMGKIWCNVAETFLFNKGNGTFDKKLPNNKPRRGEILPLERVSVAGNFNVAHHCAETNYVATAAKYKNWLKDMKFRAN